MYPSRAMYSPSKGSDECLVFLVDVVSAAIDSSHVFENNRLSPNACSTIMVADGPHVAGVVW